MEPYKSVVRRKPKMNLIGLQHQVLMICVSICGDFNKQIHLVMQIIITNTVCLQLETSDSPSSSIIGQLTSSNVDSVVQTLLL